MNALITKHAMDQTISRFDCENPRWQISTVVRYGRFDLVRVNGMHQIYAYGFEHITKKTMVVVIAYDETINKMIAKTVLTDRQAYNNLTGPQSGVVQVDCNIEDLIGACSPCR